MNLINKFSLITGSSRGIGASTAIKLASEGSNIIINYNNSLEEANKLKEDIESRYNVVVMVIKADITKEKEVENMINSIIEQFGRIDILVNNAGISKDSLFSDKTVEDFKNIIDTNLIGPFIVTKYVSKYMIDRKYGKIVNVVSTNAIDTYYPYGMDYDASKAGLLSLTHNLALEFAPYINVNAVAPGWIDTDMNKDMDSEFKTNETKKILLNRFGAPMEVANVIAFLVSEDAKYINNEVIRVDGGKK